MKSSRFVVPLLVVMSLMFIWNLSRNINDVLIPHLKRACQLSDLQSSLVQSAFFGGYFLLALPVGQFIRRFGYRAGMVTGLLMAAMGALLFFPAADTRYYPLFLGALFVMAAGFTFLEVTATPYISVLGAPERASSRLSLASAVGSIGATLGPYLGARFLLHTEDTPESTLAQLSPAQLETFLQHEAQLVKSPYLTLAGVFVLLGLWLLVVKLPTIADPDEASIRLTDIFRFRHTVLGALGVFCYLGAEVGIVSFLIRYAKAQQLPGLTEQKAALFITLFMALVLTGRLAGAWLLQRLNPSRLLTTCASGAALLVVVAMLTSGYDSMYALASVGLCTSVMYPILFTLSIKNLGPHTKTGSSLIIMSVVGGAVIPPIMGLLSDTQGIRLAFVIPVLCYGYVIYYSWRGHQVQSASGPGLAVRSVVN
ncbi:L-fucose:H+ symporter permease [Spirosoma aerophilum]